MADISSITSGISSLSSLILVSPQTTVGYQPQPVAGAAKQPAFVFHYEGEQTLTLDSDSTDHYVENNTPIQNNIALKPVIISTQGFIGELNDVPPNKILAAAQTVANKLGAIGSYTPGLSATALIAYNEALFAYQTLNALASSAVSTYQSLGGTLGGSTGGVSVINGNQIQLQSQQNAQQTAFQTFFGYRSQKTLFTVQTPWAIFQNMSIKSIKAIQDAESNVLSTFEVSFKQFNFASTTTVKTVAISANAYAPTSNQLSPVVNYGAGSLGSDTTFPYGTTA